MNDCEEKLSLPTPEQLYGKGTDKQEGNQYRSVYKTETAKGTAIATRYKVMPGIEIYYNDIHIDGGLDYSDISWPEQDIMVIQHCRVGRFQCEFPSGDCTYLGPGDLAVNMLSNQVSSSWYPLAHYHGISIMIDLETADRVIKEVAELVRLKEVNLYALRDKLCSDNRCFIMRTTAALEYVFTGLYSFCEEDRIKIFPLKILELLLFLETASKNNVEEKRLYFHPPQVKTIKMIEQYLTEDLKRRPTLKELSLQFNISLTAMKTCFREIYGTSIYQYSKQYRLQAAATLLRETNLNIAEISDHVGYQSPSKFSAAFHKVMGKTPSDYRKSFCPNGTITAPLA